MGIKNKNTTTFLATIKKFKLDYMIQRFALKIIYADRASESCKSKLNEQGITLLCCDTNSHVPFIEQAIRFVNERVRYVQSVLPKRIKRVPARLMRELTVSTVKMINSIIGERMSAPGYVSNANSYWYEDGVAAISNRIIRVLCQGQLDKQHR